jgi:hypothetical protein
MKKLNAILIGAGNRGITYTDIMKELPDEAIPIIDIYFDVSSS